MFKTSSAPKISTKIKYMKMRPNKKQINYTKTIDRISIDDEQASLPKIKSKLPIVNEKRSKLPKQRVKTANSEKSLSRKLKQKYGILIPKSYDEYYKK